MLTKNNIAFSLVELLVAVSIVMIFSTISYSGYQAFSVRATHTHMLERLESQILRSHSEIALSTHHDVQMRFESGAIGVIIERNTLKNLSHISVWSYDWRAMTGSIVPVSLEKSELVSSFINQKKVSSFLADPSSTGVGFSFTGTRLESLSLSSLSAGQIEFFYFTPGYIDEVLRDPYTLTLSGTTSTGVTLINFRNQKVLRAYDGTILDSVDLILQNSRISLSFPLAWK